jgi:hypothetical protein
LEEDEWAMEELPDVFGMIGPAAILAVAAYIADGSHSDWSRIHATACLEKIGKMHPESRDECIATLVRPLERCDENDPTLNAFLVYALVELKDHANRKKTKNKMAKESSTVLKKLG